MVHDATSLNILRDIDSFSKLKRYKGMLPFKFVQFYPPRLIEQLVREGYIERLVVSFPCGSEPQFLKLTKTGKELLHQLASNAALLDEAEGHSCDPELTEKRAGRELTDVTDEQVLLLNDIYHYSQITKYNGLMPLEKLDACTVSELNKLFAKGYVIRVKAETGGGKKRKGLLLTEKGLLVLNAAQETGRPYTPETAETVLL